MNWHFKEKAPKEFISKFPEYTPLVLQLLYDRDLKTQSQIDEFFNADYEADLHDPFLMKGVREGVREIKKAIKQKKKILIFGDYDADGICSTVILKETLEKIGAHGIEIYIPDRSKEGYGLNEEAVKRMKDQGIELMITVDCGICEVENIKLAKKIGIETIIVDHHQCPKIIPQARVIINPHQSGDKYPFKDLAAVGVVFKFIQALITDAKIDPSYTKWLLDLVALATVADLVPLLGENRTLVKYGLVVLAQTKRVGLKKLMEISRVVDYTLEVFVNDSGQKEHKVNGLDSMTLAFALAPRINVAARLGSVDSAYQLLVTQSEDEAREIAQRLEKLNRQRQQMVRNIVSEVEGRLNGYQKLPIVVCEEGDNWSPGVIGLIAGKIKDKFNRPVFICNSAKDDVRCSVRSINGFDIVEAMNKCSSLLEEFGGHPKAAGLTIKKKNLDKFRKKIQSLADKKLKKEDLEPKTEIDTQLIPSEISWESYDLIQRFAPFGKDNSSPLFLTKKLEIIEIRIVGKTGKHLKLELFGAIDDNSDKMKKIKAIGFGLGEKGYKLKIGDQIDVVFELIADQYNSTRNLQLKIIDFKKHE